MSFLAKLILEDEELTVLQCGFRLSQVTDNTGKPQALPQGGTIHLLVESDGSSSLFDWMISPVETKNGTITFFRRDNQSKLKSLSFNTAHCVDYYETFDHQGETPMQIQLTISAKELTLIDSQFINNWPS